MFIIEAQKLVGARLALAGERPRPSGPKRRDQPMTRYSEPHVLGRMGGMAVILFNVAALKVVGAVFAVGALAWVAHALGR
jgi:hypothetical protein